MTAKYHQIFYSELFSLSGQNDDESPSFFKLLSKYINLTELIPSSFDSSFYPSTGRNYIHALHGFLSSFILQKIFSIPTDSLLLLFLNICRELHDFYGFSNVPNASLFLNSNMILSLILSSYFNKWFIIQGLLKR